MKVLSISTDRKIFTDGSPVQSRSIEYAKRMEELHIVVFTLEKEKHTPKQMGNLYIYPTNSMTQWSYVASAKKLAKKIALTRGFKNDESVISVQDPFQTGLVGLYLKKKFGLPLQVQIHTDFLSRHFSGFLNMIRKKMARKVLRSADGVRVVSSVIADSLTRKYKKLKAKIDILPVFVDVEKISNTPITKDLKKDFSQFKFIIFMASRLSKEKKIGTALYALREILKKYPWVGLVIAGKGPEQRNIIELSRRLGLEKNIQLIGWQDDLISYYKTCNVFLLTSKYEGYGMTLIEAGAAGATIITTKVGVAKTDLFVSGVNSYICPVGDHSWIANCIISVIEDNQKRELFGHAIQEAVRKNAGTPGAYFEKYVDLLSALLPKRDAIISR